MYLMIKNDGQKKLVVCPTNYVCIIVTILFMVPFPVSRCTSSKHSSTHFIRRNGIVHCVPNNNHISLRFLLLLLLDPSDKPHSSYLMILISSTSNRSLTKFIIAMEFY